MKCLTLLLSNLYPAEISSIHILLGNPWVVLPKDFGTNKKYIGFG